MRRFQLESPSEVSSFAMRQVRDEPFDGRSVDQDATKRPASISRAEFFLLTENFGFRLGDFVDVGKFKHPVLFTEGY